MSPAKKRPVAVVVQTHWDREWYFAHQTFVARLLGVMARVVGQLESGQLKQFLFDGQTAAYEDLMANAEPLLASRVQSLVRERRIVLGPWYVMADEFLVTGESLLRNLEIGIADAEAAGNCQYVGYLPDTFGHIGQMPQLLANFNITSAVMWRGVDSAFAEFDWQSPDGTKLGAVFLTQGYYQHPLNVAEWQAALIRYLDSIAPRAIADELLLTQGGDHLLSVDAVAMRIAEFNASGYDYQLTQKSLAEHVTNVLTTTQGRRATIHGALRNNTQAFVLPDVLSTRRYLKRLNQHAEDRLLGVIEPLLAQLDDTNVFPAKYLRDTWRMVIQQQAHDSICGCSIDQVHREMLTRYRLIDQRLDALFEQATTAVGMTSAAHHHVEGDSPARVFADDSTFTLFNPLPKPFDGSQVISLFLRGDKSLNLSITTADGIALPCEIIAAAPDAIFRSPVDDFPERFEGFRYEVMVQCRIGGLAALACVANKIAVADTRRQTPMPAPPLTAIENTWYRISLAPSGTLSVARRNDRAELATSLSIMSELDAGDSYNFSPPSVPHRITQNIFTLVSSRVFDGMQELTLAIAMTLPAELSADRRERSVDQVACNGTLRIRLFADQPTVDCSLEWTNRAKDQRTRMLLLLPETVECTYSDTGFEWGCYPVRYADYPREPSRREMPVVVNPSLSAIAAGELTVLHRAMQEYEMLLVNGQQVLGVTLVRSVGWMSRRDLVTRGVGAGPDMATPEAQCLGAEPFEFQISLGQHPQHEQHPMVMAERFRRSLVCLRGATSRWRDGIEIDNPVLQVSAVRRFDEAIEIRIWNPTDVAQPYGISSGSWMRVNANGTPSTKPLMLAGPHEIVTLRCRR